MMGKIYLRKVKKDSRNFCENCYFIEKQKNCLKYECFDPVIKYIQITEQEYKDRKRVKR